MLLQQFRRLFPAALHDPDIGHEVVDADLADLRIGVLRQEDQGLFQQLGGPGQLLLIVVFAAEDHVQDRAEIDDIKRVGIFCKRLFDFGQAFRILSVDVSGQPVHGGFQAVVLHFIPQEDVDGNIKEIRRLHDEPQLGQGLAGFPFIDRADGDTQHFSQLLLGHLPLFPEGTDILRKLQFHLQDLLALSPAL